MELKVGDWVTIPWHEDNEPHRISSIWEGDSTDNVETSSDPKSSIFFETCAYRLLEECEHWKPKEGEVFWGPRDLHYIYPYDTRIELFQLNQIHPDGTYSLISPLDKNVYSLYINPEDIKEFLSKCQPFIGELPIFTEDLK